MNATPQQAYEQIIAASPPNYPTMFRNRVAESSTAIAFTVPQGEGWRDVSWAEVRKIADRGAAGLLALGLQAEERVAIASNTRFEWVLADLAIACAAGATTTVYPNTTGEEMGYILTDSGSKMVFAEDAEQLDKVLALTELNDKIEQIIVLADDAAASAATDERVMSWQELLDKGEAYLAEHPDSVDTAIASAGPDTLSTLIYTSGTTGRPKGVQLLHRNWTYEGYAIKYLDFVTSDDVLYLWLPLSHVFGRDLVSLQLSIGFRSVVDGRIDRIVQGLGETHPTILVGVPRIFEKVRAAVLTMNPSGGLKGRISKWAFDVGRATLPWRLDGRPLPAGLGIQFRLADKLVFSKLKQKLGGNMRFMVSGSAKLSRQVQEWFYSAGITIIEGYGATETAAIAFVDHEHELPRHGSVGRAIPGLEVRIAEDGEVLLKGATIARGYHNLPEETDAAFVDGWYQTGDIGVLDGDGYLTITDRKKDLFKTSSGKYVAPQKVENTVMANIPYVSQVVAIGDDRKYVTALLALDPVSLQKWADKRGKGDLPVEELSQLPEIRKSIERLMRRANSRLERWEQVKRFKILESEFSLADGTLTPSLKVRRGEVAATYADEIEQLYADDATSDLDK